MDNKKSLVNQRRIELIITTITLMFSIINLFLFEFNALIVIMFLFILIIWISSVDSFYRHKNYNKINPT